MLRKLLGEVLRRTRLEQRRTLADVARKACISMPYLSEVERGRKEASSEVLAALCDALHIDLYDVLTEVGRDLARERARVLRSVRPVRSERPLRLERPSAQHHISPPVRRSGDTLLLAA